MTDSWDRIEERIQELQHRIQRTGSLAWYRGQRLNRPWPLLSKLHRHVLELCTETGLNLDEPERHDYFRDEYKTLYRRFKMDAWPLLEEKQRSDWGIIFSMQHHGLPTRLLDWTESFACALYFAEWQRRPEDEAVIYVLDPMGLNLVAVKQEGLIQLDESEAKADSGETFNVHAWHPKWKTSVTNLPTIAVAPIYVNPRMLAQRSAFTLSGDSFFSLEEEFSGRLVADGVLTKVVLPPDTFADCERFLDLAGVNPFSFFPDLEGLRMKHEAATRKTIAEAKEFHLRNSSDHGAV